jgi:hypothetical protein
LSFFFSNGTARERDGEWIRGGWGE